MEGSATNRSLPAIASTGDVDRAVRAGLARLTGGLAPSALAGAFFDWAVHLAASPGKRLELVSHAVDAAVENVAFATHCARGRCHRPMSVPAIEAATAITGAKRVHGVGYCLGGTLPADK